jgi:hypothetical protein
VINIGSFTCEDKSPYRPDPWTWPPGPGPVKPTRRVKSGFGLFIIGLADRLAIVPRRLGDRLFAANDTEAFMWGWEITRTQFGLGRRYRDHRFATLAECARCRGAGTLGGASCAPCLGTGRTGTGAR